MSTYITYAGKIIASGQATPLVGRSEEMIRYGERWGTRSILTMQGVLTGCTFQSLVSAQSGLIQDFSKDFQSLQIVEDNNVVYNKPFAWTRSINFGESRYVGILPYTVTVECYDSGYFSGSFGVLEPSDEWSFEEQQDGTIRMSHVIAARGFNTSSGYSNAFDNAKGFVLGRTGWSGQAVPTFITGVTPYPCLQSFSEKIDRINGSYSVTEEFLYDRFSTGTCTLLRYSAEYDCNPVEGRTTVSLRGEIRGGQSQSLSDLRSRYSGFNAFAAAQSVDESNSILSGYLSRSITEDATARRLSFDIVYDNSPVSASGVYFDYTTQIATNEEGLTRASLDGTIKGRGDLTTRWANVQAYYGTLNLFGIVSGAYANSNQSTVPLNSFPISSGNSYSQFTAEMGVNVVFDNRPIPANPNFREINMTHGFTNGIQKVGAVPLLRNECNSNKSYYVVDLGYATRAEFTLEGTAKPLCDVSPETALTELKSVINDIAATEAVGNRKVLTKQQFTTSRASEGDIIKFACAWTFEGAAATSPSSYDQLLKLGL